VNAVILASIVLRVAGVGYSLLLLSRSDDRRFGFLTVMLALMATRQILSARGSTTPVEELPGLVVSVLAVLTVYYLSSYVVEERRITDRLRGYRKAIEHAGHAIFLTDTDGTIEYANPAVESVIGYEPDEVVGENPRLWKSGEHEDAFYEDLWARITAGDVWEGEMVNRRQSGALCWVDATIAPITDEDGDVERYVAVERDVTDRKERELRIEQQHDRLERLNTTNEVLRDVNRELVAAATRRDIERVVCERFAAAELFDDAWVGEPRLADGGVDVRASAGVEVDVEGSADGAGSAYRGVVDDAIESGEAAFVDAERVPTDDPSRAASVAVPLSYNDADYGVLFVDAATDDAFDAIDRTLFAELGSTVADAINAAESRRTLATDDVTELEFRVGGADDPLVDLSAALDCTVDLERVGGDSGGGRTAAYVSVAGCERAAVTEHADEADGLTDAQFLCADGDCGLYRLRTDGASMLSTLGTYGAAVTGLTVDGGSGRLVAAVSSSNGVRPVVGAVQSAHPELDLVAQRERERDADSETEVRSAFEDALTARQLEAAETAHFAGFFEWPRAASGEDVASMMDISQSTFTQHLRAAERKLFQTLFDDREEDTKQPASA